MGGVVSAGVDHDDLIDKLMETTYIRTPSIEHVFRAVDRGLYFLPECHGGAYQDLAWKKGNIHLSAPCIYGEVMERLELAPGMSFLNLGSGTGYLSTMAGLILGTYGVNHGVELHQEVLEYAHKKLAEFKLNSPAIDRYEFCVPIFVKGNCLCLSSSSRQYDRVYCGAACPENHENYMKHLLKVGGVLVMPLNEQLVKITRKSETQWENREVLPVSFSSLQLPSFQDAEPHVVLPDIDPLSLLELCRSAIRIILRQGVEKDYPTIAIRNRKIYPPRKNMLDIAARDSDDSVGEEDDIENSNESYHNVISVLNIASAVIPRLYPDTRSDLLDRVGIYLNTRGGVRRRLPDSHTVSSDAEDDDEDGDEDNSEHRSKILKREKQDSGVADMDNSQGQSSSDNSIEDGDDLDTTSPTPMKVDVPLYTEVMKDRIATLPLPTVLIDFLNYNRPDTQ